MISALYILIDTSPSMKGSTIAAVNRLFEDLYHDLKAHDIQTLAPDLEVCVLTYDQGARVHSPWSPIGHWSEVSCGEGRSDAGAALRLLDHETARARDAGDGQPAVILITDGGVTDNFMRLVGDWTTKGRGAACSARLAVLTDPSAPTVAIAFTGHSEAVLSLADGPKLAQLLLRAIPPSLPSDWSPITLRGGGVEDEDLDPLRLTGAIRDDVAASPVQKIMLAAVQDGYALRMVDVEASSIHPEAFAENWGFSVKLAQQAFTALHKIINVVDDKPGYSLYETLGVSPAAPSIVIDAAYQAQLSLLGPSRRLARAYNTLSDPQRREQYDVVRKTLTGTVVKGIQLGTLIASGTHSKTYKGTHELLQEPVCVKHYPSLTAPEAEALLNETRTLWNLRHFALPAVRDAITLPDASMMLVTSYIEGPTLEMAVTKAVAEKRRLDPEQLAWVMSRLLNALGYMHRHGAIHGDIAPQNIILQPEEHAAFLVNFKIGKGSNKYYTTAPEILAGGAPTVQSDFFALGATILYALSGNINMAKDMMIPQDVPDPMCRFIGNLLRSNASHRPDWQTDQIQRFDNVRRESFGRTHSVMTSMKV